MVLQKLVGGKEALIAAATIQEATIVVTAIVGAAVLNLL